jgi:hypothetical protein
LRPPILGVLSPALAQSKQNAKVNFKKSTQRGTVTDKLKIWYLGNASKGITEEKM